MKSVKSLCISKSNDLCSIIKLWIQRSLFICAYSFINWCFFIHLSATQKKKMVFGINSQSHNEAFKSVRSWATPSLSVEKFDQLNDVQRKVVVALGFGGLLELKIREVPQKLAYFVLSSFDCDRCDILLPPGNLTNGCTLMRMTSIQL